MPIYPELHAAIQERALEPHYGGGRRVAASRIAEQKRTQETRDNLKKATRVLLEVTKKQEDALKKHLQRAADPNEFRGMVYPYELIPEEERTKINDAIHGYYSMKEKYNSALEKRRQRLINDPNSNWKTLSSQQKARRLALIKPACIVCKQEGGSIFTETDGKLKAICGNISQPCGFHIEVFRGKYISLETLMNESLEEVRATKDEIIRMKLDLLFQFINEDELLAQFDAVQHKLQEQMKMYSEFRTYYLSVTDNEDRRKDTETHTRVIAEKIALIKEYMTEFRESEWKNRSIIDDILVLYQQDIEPAFMKLRETKYVYSQVETAENAEGSLVQMYNDGEFNLSQKMYSYNELYMPVIMPKWIADNRIVSNPVGAVVAPTPVVQIYP
ncbi:MAG: hypothetical protein EBU66_11600 [Bacteroidetes bacterium]|nr:hypothetical protein [bacterium]NBP65286.1 hypothetical protein [Bacteroidota bacterium]